MRRSSILILGAVIIAVLQIGFLAWTITTRAAVLRDGREVLLKVEPIDPRDLLRGDYVVLSYDISRLKPGLFGKLPDGNPDYTRRTIWVALRKGPDNLFQPVKAALTRKELGDLAGDDVVIRGETREWPNNDYDIFANYGIERFYLPEGEGKQIEQDMRQRPFFVVASVDADGTAQIKAFKDGETTLFEEPYY